MRDAGDTGRTRADTPPNPSRRGLLAGTTAAAMIAGAGAATAAPGVPPALAGTDSPDAELIRLCDRLVVIEAMEAAVYAAVDDAEADERDEALKPFTVEWHAIAARLYEIGGPRTPQGTVAMARAAVATSITEPDGSFDTVNLTDWLAINAAACVARSGS